MTLRGESDFKKKQGKKEKTDLGQPRAERAADEDIPADREEGEVRIRRAEPIGRKGYSNGRRRIFQRTVQL